MKKSLSILSIITLLISNLSSLAVALEPTINTSLTPVSPINSNIDIIKDWITASNAWLVMSEKVFTTWNLSLENLKFTVVKWAKIWLDNKIKDNFEVTNKTRINFNNAKIKSNFKAWVNYEDKIIEYPDRVRIITKSKYSYNNKSEYDTIFSGTTSAEVISSKDVTKFLMTHPKYKNKYSTWIPKVNKKDIIEKLTDKLFLECSKKTILAWDCNKSSLKVKVENELNAYKWVRTIIETIDVNKIPLVYDADKSIDFTERLKDSNISKEPKDVRLSNLQIKNSFAQYASLNISNNAWTFSTQEQTANKKSCVGKWPNCQKELDALSANNSNSNTPVVFSGTLLNGFTLWKSYSYTLSDSYSAFGYTVYDIWVTFYAWYGAGIRIPIEYKATITKDKLEKWVSEDYTVSLEVDTVKRDKDWFVNALWENKAFDWKEAVLEAWAYAKWWIVLFEQTVFNEQIWGKKDWGSDQKIPFWYKEWTGEQEKTEIFKWEVKWNEIWLELILYWVHISWDLEATWYISGDITYECRSVYSTWSSADWIYCKDLLDTKLKDDDVTDIKIDSKTKVSTLNMKWVSDKFYYKNDLWVYQKYWVNLNNFKYKPDLSIDLSLRWKVWVDTWDYFGRFWLETPRLKVYTFELDLPTLRAHSWYNPKKIEIFDNNYLYNFSKSIQDTNETMDSSTACRNYSLSWEKDYYLGDKRFLIPNSGWNFMPSSYPEYYNYNFGWNMYYKTDWALVHQLETWRTYLIKSVLDNSFKSYGYTRKFWEDETFYTDYKKNNTSEMQFVVWNTVYYYSQAENAIYTGDIKDRNTWSPTPKIKNDTKYKALDNTKKPKRNSFNDPVLGEEIEEDITDYHAAYKFKKFNFAFSSDFSENKMFAYISEYENNYHEIKRSIMIYKNKAFYKEIDENEIDYNNINPIHIELIWTNLIIISDESSQNEKKYVVYEYSYNSNAWVWEYVIVPDSEKKEATFNTDEIPTAFSYDKQNKTLFVSYLKKKSNWWANYDSKIASIRFNGNINIPYKKDIYETHITKEELISKIEQRGGSSYEENDYISANNNLTQSYITNIQLWKNTNSLLISLDHSFAWDWGSGGGSTSKQHYVYTEAKELNFNTSEWQKDNEWNCINNTPPPPAPSVMNVNLNQTYQACLDKCDINDHRPLNECLVECQEFKTPADDSNSNNNSNNYTSTDSYVNEKLQEINTCFVDSYNSQLANINNSIDKLIIEKDKQTEGKAKIKYSKAITKLEEIKRLFILKYSSIINIPNPIPVRLNNTSSGSYVMPK